MSAKQVTVDLPELERLMRTGQTKSVCDIVETIDADSLPRSLLADVANVARRAGATHIALRLLRPVVRAERLIDVPASAKERAIYAAALADFGAQAEAMAILDQIEEETAEVLLYRSFVAIYSWDYASAKRDLRRYLKLEGLTAYQRVIAQLNLAAAYRFLEEDDEFDSILHGIMEAAVLNGWILIQRNALDLAIQAAIFRHDWEGAESRISECLALSAQHKLDEFFLRKWQLLLKIQRDGAESVPKEEFAQVRHESVKRGDWETVRDLDYHQALSSRDSALFLKVMFGTAHPAYRRRMRAKSRGWLVIPEVFEWFPGESREEAGTGQCKLDLVENGSVKFVGLEAGKARTLEREQALLKVMRILASDFYRAFKIGTLFARVYPNEQFDAESSPERARSLIRRTRRWLEDSNVPLEIRIENGEVRLASTGPVSLCVMLEYPDSLVSKSEDSLQLLKTKWPYKAFSVAQAAEALNISNNAAGVLLRNAFTNKKIHKSGLGRATRYRFAK